MRGFLTVSFLFVLSLSIALGIVTVRSTSAANPKTCNGLTATFVGTAGDDVLVGTAGADVIVGLAGDDVIRGGAGDDVICGGPGNDYIEGQGGDDVLFGDAGDDTLDGGTAGCCDVQLNSGDDELHGGPGQDVLHTSDFPTLGNILHGDEGDDQLFVWQGGWAYGDEGNDVIRQYSRDAVLDGGNGDDVIIDGNDGGFRTETVTLLGGRGDDVLRSEDLTSTANLDGGSGEDECSGGDTEVACET